MKLAKVDKIKWTKLCRSSEESVHNTIKIKFDTSVVVLNGFEFIRTKPGVLCFGFTLAVII